MKKISCTPENLIEIYSQGSPEDWKDIMGSLDFLANVITDCQEFDEVEGSEKILAFFLMTFTIFLKENKALFNRILEVEDIK